ncbi:MAG TPA: 50S ribosomal protein L17 [Candidatus Avilachnospira avistercoris]|nr:50S ribosomal protein L17 [Candidatus Avilachnospira avistercoris]
MPGYRKLGKTSSQRKALLRNQVTALLYHGRIVTTEARAKEVRRLAEPLIALAVKERDNYETVEVTAKVPRKDKDGKRVKEVKEINGKQKKVTVYDEVKKTIKKDKPSRLHARRKMLSMLYDVTEVPAKQAGRKKGTKQADIVGKLFDEYGTKYANRNGGYTRIIKIGPRKGDAAMEVVLELV